MTHYKINHCNFNKFVHACTLLGVLVSRTVPVGGLQSPPSAFCSFLATLHHSVRVYYTLHT